MLWETANGNECGRTTATIIFFWALRISLRKLRLSDAFGRRSFPPIKVTINSFVPWGSSVWN